MPSHPGCKQLPGWGRAAAQPSLRRHGAQGCGSQPVLGAVVAAGRGKERDPARKHTGSHLGDGRPEHGADGGSKSLLWWDGMSRTRPLTPALVFSQGKLVFQPEPCGRHGAGGPGPCLALERGETHTANTPPLPGAWLPTVSPAQGHWLSSSAVSAHAELPAAGAASSQGPQAWGPMHGGTSSHPRLWRRPLGAGEAPAAGPSAGWVRWARTPPGGVLPRARGPLPPAPGRKSAWPWVLVRSPPPAGAPHLPARSLSHGALSAAGVPLISAVTF